MALWHINNEGMKGECNVTTGKCPFGGESGTENHYATAEEAELEAERRKAEKNDPHSTLKKTKKKVYKPFSAPGLPPFTPNPLGEITVNQIEAADGLMDVMKVYDRLTIAPSRRGYFNDIWADNTKTIANSKGGVGKVDKDALWSKDALAYCGKSAEERKGKRIKEHVVPVTIQLRYVRQAIKENRSPREVAELLRSFPMAVITVEENQRLNDAGFNRKMPAGWASTPNGIWERYVQAGLPWNDYVRYETASENAKKGIFEQDKEIEIDSDEV